MVKLLNNRKLIPIFGAGLTMNEKAGSDGRGMVPGGPRLAELMNDLLREQGVEEEELEEDFNEICDIFLNSSRISDEDRLKFFRDKFTEVTLSDLKKNFLRLAWEFAFTLNIDDGIERNSDFTPINPFNKIRRNSGGKRLYKLHGDIYQYLEYEDGERKIIFSQNQYIKSLTDQENKDFIERLEEAYQYRSILYMGCSLIREDDLNYVYKKLEEREAIPSGSKRIYLTERKLSKKEANQLRRKFGINTIIQLQNIQGYAEFYKGVISGSKIKKIEIGEGAQVQVNTLGLGDEHSEENLEYFIEKNIFDYNKRTLQKTKFHVKRTVLMELEDVVRKNPYVLIKGRRFAGKTSLILDLIERASGYEEILYFSAEGKQDEVSIRRVLEGKKESLLIFDSNTLSENGFQYIVNSSRAIEENSNKVIVALNSNETFLSERLEAPIVEVNQFFDTKELKEINKKLDKEGYRRKRKGCTNLEYIQLLSGQSGREFKKLELKKNLDLSEKTLLYILAATDKVFLSTVTALGIYLKQKDEFLSKMGGIIEEIPTKSSEKEYSSVMKLVHNSKSVVLQMVNDFDEEEVVEIIEKIAQNLYNGEIHRRIYIECIMFDTLGQIFNKKFQDGSRRSYNSKLIFKIYEMLQQYANTDRHYWIQRAKSIHRMKENDYVELLNAKMYAQKALEERDELDEEFTERRLKEFQTKAYFTLSLIYCLLARAERRKERTEAEISISGMEAEALFSFIKALELNKDLVPTNMVAKTTDDRFYKFMDRICTTGERMGHGEFRDMVGRVRKILNRIPDKPKKSLISYNKLYKKS